jgi:pimeloyl-ACP methyl ester carboxylesterase
MNALSRHIHRIIGPLDSTKTLLFVHGFPDTSAIFDDMARTYAKRGYRCVLVDMPYYTGDDSQTQPYFGLGMTEIADLLHGVVEATKIDDSKLTIVAHDMGVVYSLWLLAKFPADAVAIVQFEIGYSKDFPIDDHEPITLQGLVGYVYQYAIIVLWLIDRMPIASGILKLCTNFRPLKFNDGGREHVVIPASGYSYFYIHLYKMSKYLSTLTGIQQLSLFPIWSKNRPKHPVLFVYGTAGKTFHGEEWKASLDSRMDGSKSVALDAGHWVFTEVPERVDTVMTPFLETMFI